MKKKILLGLFLATGLAVPASRAVAQMIYPESEYFGLHIGLTGHIYCYGDGSDCRVG